MYENEQPQPEQAQDTATLLNRIDELTKQLERKTAEASSYLSGYETRGEILGKVRTLVEKEIDKGGWDTDDEFCQGLCEALDIDLTEEVEIEIRTTWTATVTIPRGYQLDLGDIEASFDAPDLSHYANIEVTFDSVYEQETEVNEG
jgi:hypothetical protein